MRMKKYALVMQLDITTILVPSSLVPIAEQVIDWVSRNDACRYRPRPRPHSGQLEGARGGYELRST